MPTGKPAKMGDEDKSFEGEESMMSAAETAQKRNHDQRERDFSSKKEKERKNVDLPEKKA